MVHGLIQIKDKVVLAGAGKDVTVIDFDSGPYHIFARGVSSVSTVQNFEIRDLTVRRSAKLAAIDLQFARAFVLSNVRTTLNTNNGFQMDDCEYWLMFNCLAEENLEIGFRIIGLTDQSDFFTMLNCTAAFNGDVGFRLNDQATNDVASFRLIGCHSVENTSHGFHIGNATTLQLNGNLTACTSETNGGKGFAIDARAIYLVGCAAGSNGGDGFEILQPACVITGCNSFSNTGTDFDIQASCALIGSLTAFSSSTNPSLRASDFDNNNPEQLGNMGLTFKHMKESFRMQNNTGTTLREGTVVVLGTDANAMQIEPTTTNGHNRVFGMCLENIPSTGATLYGSVLTKGWTSLLFVNNSAASIAVGDFLSTYSHAYYAKKAVAGDTVFAVALEAPTTGTAQIDACLISPRLI